jgi:hypothetical protein
MGVLQRPVAPITTCNKRETLLLENFVDSSYRLVQIDKNQEQACITALSDTMTLAIKEAHSIWVSSIDILGLVERTK